ncbi:MAG: efflux RND transporter periplasmic adaptor subunit [Candidatus Eisenbacteria bacterium]
MSHRGRIILGAIVLVIAAIVVWRIVARDEAQATTFRTEEVQRGDVRVTVSATGTLNAVTTVQVGSQVSGTISALYADFNSPVHKGQVLAQIDPTFLKAQVSQSEADLERAQVTLRQAERDYDRQKPLREQGLASQAEIDAAETALDAARAGVKSAQAALSRAQTNLRYATITSPIDGTVISRDVDVGQTVAASLSAPTLFTIAQDLSQMQLEASVDEADIGQIRVSQPTSFTVDAYPDQIFHGVVEQIRLAPQTEQNVVSYTVIVRVDNPDGKLLPGMTANATFLVAEETNVLKVPVAALRFQPNGARGPSRPPSGGTASAAPIGPGGPAAGGQGGAVNGGRQGGRMDGPAGEGGMNHPGAGGRGARVWVLHGEKPRAVHVVPGLSDGTFTAVRSDSLSEGMEVIVGAQRPGGGQPEQGQVNPFLPSPRGGRSGGGRR